MSKREFFARGLLSLLPEGGWGVDDSTNSFEDIHWRDGIPLVSKAELIAESTKQQAIYERTLYQRERFDKYPPVKDQLDMLWHAIDQGKVDKTSDFYLAIKKVKDEYPKLGA